MRDGERTEESILKNPLKAKLKEGKPAYGIGLSIGHPDVAEIIGKLGYDWAFIDTEHSPMGVRRRAGSPSGYELVEHRPDSPGCMERCGDD